METHDFFLLSNTCEIGEIKLPFRIWEPLHPVTGSVRPKRLILFIYGGSKNFSQRLLGPLVERFVRNGYWAATFDHREMLKGYISEDEPEAGIYTRIEDAKAMLAKVKKIYSPDEVIVWGISMGGYIATHLLPEVGRAILVAPAIYDSTIIREKILFGPKLTEALHKKNGLMNSDSLNSVHKFNKPLLILKYSADDVIAPEITDGYFSVGNKLTTEMITLPLIGHAGTFVGGITTNRQEIIANASLDWLRKTQKE